MRLKAHWILLLLCFSLLLDQSSAYSLVEEQPTWWVEIGDLRAYLLTTYYNTTAEGSTSHLVTTIRAINGSTYPVTLEIGTVIQLNVTSFFDDIPVGTIFLYNPVFSDCWLSFFPLTFMQKTIDNASFWRQFSAYDVIGDFVIENSFRQIECFEFHYIYRKFNFHTGWIEHLNHTLTMSTTKWWEFEIIRIDVPQTSVSPQLFIPGFILPSLVFLILPLFGKYKRRRSSPPPFSP